MKKRIFFKFWKIKIVYSWSDFRFVKIWPYRFSPRFFYQLKTWEPYFSLISDLITKIGPLKQENLKFEDCFQNFRDPRSIKWRRDLRHNFYFDKIYFIYANLFEILRDFRAARNWNVWIFVFLYLTDLTTDLFEHLKFWTKD